MDEINQFTYEIRERDLNSFCFKIKAVTNKSCDKDSDTAKIKPMSFVLLVIFS